VEARMTQNKIKNKVMGVKGGKRRRKRNSDRVV
jgi:hypothetical protein